MDVQAIVTASYTSGDILTLLHDHLCPLPPLVQLTHLIQLFQSAANTHEEVAELVHHGWNYLVDNALWKGSYGSLCEFKSSLDFDHTLHPLLKAAYHNQTRLDADSKSIQKHWGVQIQDAFPSTLNPPRLTCGLAREIKRIAKLTNLVTATAALQQQVDDRLASFRTKKVPYLTPGDAIAVRQRLAECPHRIQPLETITFQSQSSSVPVSARSTLPSLPSEVAVVAINTPTVTPTDESRKPCSCPGDIVQHLSLIRLTHDSDEKIRLFKYVSEFGFSALCHSHLRIFASFTVGLYNNIPHILIIDRLTHIHTSSSLQEVIQLNRDWFQKSARPESEADYLVVYRYAPKFTPEFQIDSQAIFRRFAGHNAWITWDRDGTVILPDIFAYLNQPDIFAAIDTEFAMYRHPYRPVPGRPQMGFLRNMFYSLIQQLVRQDPVWYALIVAARPDHNYRLIYYPYIAKDSDQDERTGFLHLDLNVREFITAGHGANLLSTSLSLDQEDPDTCTIVVPGFHHHIHLWHQRRIARGQDSAGHTTNCSQQYRSEDRADWGHPVPSPCPAFGLRITRPEIIHGSTATSSHRRRVIFPWYTGIQADHLTLETPGMLNWEQIAACHRDLQAPVKTVNGETPKHSLPPFRFPAAIHLESSYPLGDALIGRRRWDDPEVLIERNILLGPYDAIAFAYVQSKRQKTLKKFQKAFTKLESIERDAFGHNSYFLHKDSNHVMQI
jgi:hypothetical protein